MACDAGNVGIAQDEAADNDESRVGNVLRLKEGYLPAQALIDSVRLVME